MSVKKEFGVIGLGRMGGNLARQAIKKGMRVVGFTLEVTPKDIVSSGLVEVRKMSDFLTSLDSPRVVFIYIPAGPSVDKLLDELAGQLKDGDLIVDGGNSYWGDSIRRYNRLMQKGIHLVDLGTSGGVEGALQGACFMAGGDDKSIERIEPILKELAVEDGYVRAGPPGAGHFTKLVHNGIEFGMLQAIGEGMNLLEQYRDKLDIAELLRCWRHGSVIRSWLVDLMETSYRQQGGLKDIPSYVDDTGEVNWLVADALKMEVPIPVISQAVMQLFSARDEKKNWARAIAMMRHGFGGHAYGHSEPAQKERKVGRVGDFYQEPS
ncbi:MAG: decarboxylating 6-phosphogluconate dehydrogenase [Elusimicrobia bacterium]|nr:decarboxylating 6-phosphogluconate dehydrogenase [Elusimicrobiota bacterium]